MSANKYIVFAKVAETLNLSRAAAELNYTQSNVSHIIRGFEKEVGLPLIIREKNGISLTDCGKRILIPIREMLKYETAIENIVQSMQHIDEGHIKVGVFSSVLLQWVPHVLKNITHDHPQIEVELIQGDYATLDKMLDMDQLDCTFMIENDNRNNVFIPLYTDEFFVILPKGHPLCSLERIPREMLCDYPLILIDEGGVDYGTYKIVKDINVNIQYWLKEDFGAIALCEKGIGISIIPGLTLRNLSKDIDIVVKRFAVPRYRELGIALPSLQYAAPLTNLFVDTCVDFTAVYANAPEFQESLWFDPK